jgi:hypothetical protein
VVIIIYYLSSFTTLYYSPGIGIGIGNHCIDISSSVVLLSCRVSLIGLDWIGLDWKSVGFSVDCDKRVTE